MRRGATRRDAERSEAAAHRFAGARLHDSEYSVKKSIDLPSDVSN